ncbi:MAG: amidohydrolase family protein, partial [Terrimicrobiaceae bacterium]
MKTLRSKFVLPMSSPAIEDGAVQVEGDRIVGVGRWEDFQTPDAIDLGESVLMPGLINAHCHLDYTCLRGTILPPENFASWIARLNDIKRTLTDDDYVASVQQGLDESLRTGTTTILNIESFPEILLKLKRPIPRVWWFLELLDIRSRIGTEELIAGALALLDQPADWLGGPGLSPHAPFTTSLALYRLAVECAALRKVPVMTHLAETQEELDLFVDGTGPLYDFLAKLGRDMSDLDGRSPVVRLFEPGVLPKGAILTHMNALTESDWGLLASRVTEFSVVHCPRCHSYFGRPEFPIQR